MTAKVFFTSDLHFGHANVIKYSQRPFSSADEMDAVLVRNWNGVVRARDTVYVVGDLALKRTAQLLELLRSLQGHKHLIFGNHDKALRKEPKALELFESVQDLKTVKIQDPDAKDGVQRIVLCHFPMLVWDKSHYGAWHLHGHCHGTLPDDPHSLRLDVGVDAWETDVVRVGIATPGSDTRYIGTGINLIGNDIFADHEKREVFRFRKKQYRPVEYSEVKAKMSTKTWKPLDHHQDRE